MTVHLIEGERLELTRASGKTHRTVTRHPFWFARVTAGLDRPHVSPSGARDVRLGQRARGRRRHRSRPKQSIGVRNRKQKQVHGRVNESLADRVASRRCSGRTLVSTAGLAFAVGSGGGRGSGSSATLLSSRATTTGAVLAPGSGRNLTITWRGKERQPSIARSWRVGDFESARDVSYHKAIKQMHR